LKRKENAGRVNEVNQRQAVVHRNPLRAKDFLAGHGEERASFHGGVIGDHHNPATLYPPDPGDDARTWRTSPFVVHGLAGPESKFQPSSVGVDQEVDALSGGLAPLGMLTSYSALPSSHAEYQLSREDFLRDRSQTGFVCLATAKRERGT